MCMDRDKLLREKGQFVLSMLKAFDYVEEIEQNNIVPLWFITLG